MVVRGICGCMLGVDALHDSLCRRTCCRDDWSGTRIVTKQAYAGLPTCWSLHDLQSPCECVPVLCGLYGKTVQNGGTVAMRIGYMAASSQ